MKKTIKILGVTVASIEDGRTASPVPTTQGNYLSPRFEPSNITQNATVQEIQAAIREAESGEPSSLFRFYRDVLLSDNHIQSEINTRKLAMMAQPLAILPADKDNADDKQLAAAMLRAKTDCENWNAGIAALLNSHCGWPVSIVERLYQPAEPAQPGQPNLQYTLRKFVPVNYQLLCYRWAYLTGGIGLGTASAIQQGSDVAANTIDLERWEPYLKLWPVDASGRILYDVNRAEYLDRSRHIVHRGHLLTDLRDNWGGQNRALLMWWLFRNLGKEWFARGMERYGAPWPVAYTDINDATQVALLREAFDLARKIGGLVVSEDSRIELQEALTQGMAQGYEIFHKMCNDEISKLITGKDSTSKPAGLNAGEDNLVQNVREDYRVFDQMMMNETLVTQLAVPFRDVNGLRGMVRFVWGGLSDADAKTFAELLKNMKEAGFEPTDESLVTVNERTGLSWQRAAVPAPMPGDPAAFSARTLGRLIALHATPPDPLDPLVARRVAALGEAYQGAMAPFRTAILQSSSREDCLARLTALYPDWQPTRLAAELNDALQLIAAAGAASAKKKL